MLSVKRCLCKATTVQIGSQHIVRGIKQLVALPDFYWKENTAHHSPAAACLLWGSPDESITECSRVLQLKDENVWLLLHGNAIKVHMCLGYQFITVTIKSGQGKEWNWAFLTALGNRLARASPQRASCWSCFNRNPAKLADVWCLQLCAGTLFVLLLKFSAVLIIICGFLLAVSWLEAYTVLYCHLTVFSEVAKTI